jgi:membrane protein YqaA with SNARE-associated domain
MKRCLLGIRGISFLWGLLEATIFFIVPDVYLTKTALRSFKKAFISLGYALLGAIIGGSLMYFLGTSYYVETLRVMNDIPAISNDLIAIVEDGVQEDPYNALLFGALKGIPFKLFALAFGHYNISYPQFLCLAFIARSLRFMISMSIAWTVNLSLIKYSLKKRQVILYLFWTIFYVFYFLYMKS